MSREDDELFRRSLRPFSHKERYLFEDKEVSDQLKEDWRGVWGFWTFVIVISSFCSAYYVSDNFEVNGVRNTIAAIILLFGVFMPLFCPYILWKWISGKDNCEGM